MTIQKVLAFTAVIASAIATDASAGTNNQNQIGSNERSEITASPSRTREREEDLIGRHTTQR
jgi:hypothetical protein